ncbi:MAG: Type secretion system protein [Pedosphaera sp.]|nr:Type secretion system protein [Pedosphaera sp.]
MITYSYAAIDAKGRETRGTLQVADQTEALQRIKEMGFFPVKITELRPPLSPAARAQRHSSRLALTSRANNSPTRKPRGRVKSRQLALFTRQLATLLEAGMPLLRSLRLLHEQEPNRFFKGVLADLAASIEGGSSFSEALAQYPKLFDRLYLNMIKAGEIGGILESSLKRLADFMEKAARIKGKVKAAMFYPAAVVTVAIGVMALMLLVIVPRFKEVFVGLNEGRPLPAFTRFILGISDTVINNFLPVTAVAIALYIAFLLAIRTSPGRRLFDRFKLRMPVLGPVFRKLAIARFTRTLGTLITSGVPILQSLTIIREATGNVIVGRLIGRVHDNVEQGDSIVGPLRESKLFPAMVVGMVDVGEQTGALPEMLNKIADNYDEEVDNAVTAMTSLLEPIMIVFLGVVVGSIVIAMFLPIINIDPTTGMNSE